MTGPDCAVMCNLMNTHTHTLFLLQTPTQSKRSCQRLSIATTILSASTLLLNQEIVRAEEAEEFSIITVFLNSTVLFFTLQFDGQQKYNTPYFVPGTSFDNIILHAP